MLAQEEVQVKAEKWMCASVRNKITNKKQVIRNTIKCKCKKLNYRNALGRFESKTSEVSLTFRRCF